MSISNETQEIEALVDAMERMTRIGKSGALYHMEAAVNSLAEVIQARAAYAKTLPMNLTGDNNV